MYQMERETIQCFIKKVVSGSSAEGIVIGVSGGIDSAVVLTLCVNALGADRVFGLFMPTKFTPKEELDDAILLCKKLKVKARTVYLDPLIDAFQGYSGLYPVTPLTAGNLAARLRMVTLYYYANQMNYLVAGTTDRSEYFLGYYTKWGDGACDFEPIVHLTKSEVRSLGAGLDLSPSIVERKSSPRLWADHEAELELGVTYAQIDALLDRNSRSAHKRVNIPSLLDE